MRSFRAKRDAVACRMPDRIITSDACVAEGAAIWLRVQAAGYDDPVKVRGASDDDLRGCGLSRPKVRYARALALADLDYNALRSLPNDQLLETLIKVPGIGPWTAEIYAMFSLGRADVFAPSDLALQESVRVLFNLDDRPAEKQLRAMSLAWSPWRAVAARLLFSYYRVVKTREGIR